MAKDSDIAALGDAIYAALRDAGAWHSVVAKIATHIGADMGMLVSPPLGGAEPVPITLYNLDLSPVGNNPLLLRAEFTERALATGRAPGVFLFDALMPADERRTNAYWNEIIAGLNIGAGLLTVIRTPDDNNKPVVLSYYRRVADPPFTERDVQKMEILLPHLRRALGIVFDAAPAKADASTTSGAYDSIAAPAFVFDRDGSVVHRNRLAEQMLRSNTEIQLQAGRLTLEDPLAQQEFNKALKRVIGDDWSRKLRLGAEIPIGKREGGKWLVFVLTPVGVENPIAQLTAPVRCVGYVLDDTLRSDQALSSRLCRLYGLSQSEAEVAISLASGLDVEAIARNRRTRPDTVRTQVKAAMAKMSMKRRTQLIGMVNRLQY